MKTLVSRPQFRGVLLLLTLCLGMVQGLAHAQQRNLEVVQIPLPSGARESLYQESHALVIGASAYRNGWPRLPGVPGDVREVSAVLREHGFKVTVVTDPTREQLDTALRTFVQRHGGEPGNRLLVYFAGHGHTLTTRTGVRMGYIVPVDAPSPRADPNGFRATAIAMDSIEALAKQMDARHALFMFDSCFSGTIFRTRAGVPDDISDKTAKPVRQFITAGDENQTVPDESHFRRELVASLRQGAADLNRDGYITASELGMHLESQVTNYTKKAQTPRYGKIMNPELDKGDFVFVSPRGPAAAAPPVRVASAEEVEQQLWNQISNSQDPQDFRDYLASYPGGRFAALAQRQLRLLTAGPATAAATGPGSELKDCDECPTLVQLPTGVFNMGSPEGEAGRSADEGPVREVKLAYRLAVGRTEVTRGEFAQFVAATRYATEAERDVGAKGCAVWNGSKWEFTAGRNWRNPGYTQADNHPVVCVSWNDTQEYLKWLNARAPGKGFRLLSEAEWEYAARAGQGNRRFPWGDDPQARDLCAHANGADATAKAQVPGASGWTVANCSDGHAYTAPVGQFKANAFGLHDLQGNVWEWVQDVWHDTYSGAPVDGSAWLQGGDQARRVLRGGSWVSNPQFLRSAFRNRNAPGIRNGGTGFRIARTL